MSTIIPDFLNSLIHLIGFDKRVRWPTWGNVMCQHLTFAVTLVVQLVALHTVGTIRGFRSVLSDGIRGKKESGARGGWWEGTPARKTLSTSCAAADGWDLKRWTRENPKAGKKKWEMGPKSRVQQWLWKGRTAVIWWGAVKGEGTGGKGSRKVEKERKKGMRLLLEQTLPSRVKKHLLEAKILFHYWYQQMWAIRVFCWRQ